MNLPNQDFIDSVTELFANETFRPLCEQIGITHQREQNRLRVHVRTKFNEFVEQFPNIEAPLHQGNHYRALQRVDTLRFPEGAVHIVTAKFYLLEAIIAGNLQLLRGGIKFYFQTPDFDSMIYGADNSADFIDKFFLSVMMDFTADANDIYVEDYGQAADNHYTHVFSMMQLKNEAYNAGNFLPKELVLPASLKHKIVSPENDDNFCFFHCLAAALEITFEDLLALFEGGIERFYDAESSFRPSAANLKNIEEVLKININIYHYTEENPERPTLVTRSKFSQEAPLARILYVPFAFCTLGRNYTRSAKTMKALINTYHLQTYPEVATPDLDTSSGHYVLMLENSTLIAKDRNYQLCDYCDGSFRREKNGATGELFAKHKILCKNQLNAMSSTSRAVIFENNRPGDVVSFRKWATLSKQPFIVYADTESEVVTGTHRLIAYYLYVVCSFDSSLNKKFCAVAKSEEDMGNIHYSFMQDVQKIRLHVADHVNQNFVALEDCPELKNFYRKNPPEKSHNCQWCNIEFSQHERSQRQVLHHDHNTGEIVGYLCQSCNSAEQVNNNSFAVVFHNLSYDLLILLQSFGETEFQLEPDGPTVEIPSSIDVIAKSSQKYSTLKIKRVKTKEYGWLPEVRFIDSFAFINMSLANIILTLTKQCGCEELDCPCGRKAEHCKTVLPHTYKFIMGKYASEELFGYSTQKGLIAYDAITADSLKRTTNFSQEEYVSKLDVILNRDGLQNPENQRFYDHYTDSFREKIATKQEKKNSALQKDYQRTNKVFGLLAKLCPGEMTYKKYFLYYLELDIYLLADFFEFFRSTMIETHKLDPAHFMGLPGYSQNCMLYKTRKELHLIEDCNISRLISSNLRGGYAGVVNKFSDCSENVDLFKKTGDPFAPTKFIKGIDMNNLYGWAMCQKLANKFVERMTAGKYSREKPEEKANHVYFILMDYEIPAEVQERVKMFPPLISSKTITYEDLSEYSKSYTGIDDRYRSKKLVATLLPGENYLCLDQCYDFYVSLGYKCIIKEVFKFEAEFVYKDYIDFNSALRQQAQDEMRKNLYKLLNNIIYGKSLTNVENFKDFEIFTSQEDKLVQKRINSPLFAGFKTISEDLCLVHSHKAKVRYNTPIQCGFNILELAKLKMFGTLYNTMIPFYAKHGISWKLLYTDTDSLYLEYDLANSHFRSEKEMQLEFNKTGIFDTHKYQDKDLCNKANKKVVGLFLDEEGDLASLVAFVGLSAKTYSYLLYNHKTGKISEKIKGKGVSLKHIEGLFGYQDYLDIAREGAIPNNKIFYNSIKKSGFQNLVDEQSKVVLSSYDDKWYYLSPNEPVPYGYHGIE